MISQQTRNELMNEPEQKEEPKKDSDLANTLKSVERMLSLSPNEEVLKNLLDVIEANEGITENPDQMEQLNRIKVKIVAKLGGNLSENATAGATSSCSIASIPSVIGEKKNKKAKPIRRKMPGLDVMNFLECMKQDVPCGLKIRNKYFKTTMVNETLVLTVDKCVVPELNKDKLLDMVEEYFYTKEPIEVLESCVSPMDYIIMEKGMSFLLEDNQKFDRSNEKNEIDDPQKDANLKSQIGKQTIATVDKKDANEGIKNSETKKGEDEGIKTNQEMVGVDDSDPQNKKYIIKDPQTGKMSVKKQSEVEIQNEAVKYYKKPLNESDLEETKASRFNQHLDNREQSFATISAERTNDDVKNKFGYNENISVDASDEEKKQNQLGKNKFKAFNNRRTKKLKDILNHFGFKGYIRTKGGFKELNSINVNEENSVFVPNITKDMAIRIGKMFNQDSIFFKEKGSDVIEELITNEKMINNTKDKSKQNKKIGDKTGLVMYCCQGRTNNNLDDTFYSRPIKANKKFSFNKHREYGVRKLPTTQRYESDFQNQEELDAYRDEIRKENPQTYKFKDE